MVQKIKKSWKAILIFFLIAISSFTYMSFALKDVYVSLRDNIRSQISDNLELFKSYYDDAVNKEIILKQVIDSTQVEEAKLIANDLSHHFDTNQLHLKNILKYTKANELILVDSGGHIIAAYPKNHIGEITGNDTFSQDFMQLFTRPDDTYVQKILRDSTHFTQYTGVKIKDLNYILGINLDSTQLIDYRDKIISTKSVQSLIRKDWIYALLTDKGLIKISSIDKDTLQLIKSDLNLSKDSLDKYQSGFTCINYKDIDYNIKFIKDKTDDFIMVGISHQWIKEYVSPYKSITTIALTFYILFISLYAIGLYFYILNKKVS